MAILKSLDGSKKIKENYQNIPDDISAVNEQLENHVDGSADRHTTSDVDNASPVVGATQTEVNVNLQNDRASGDAALQSQIDTLVVGGTVDPLTDVYKAKDLVNLNDYAITYGSIVPFDGMRFNIEVAQTNTGASTLNLNGNGAEPVLYLRDGVTYPVIGGMITGITELQYSVTHGGYIILTKEIPIKSDPITNISSVHQLGGDTYKDMEFDGVGETTIYGETAVQLIENGDFSDGSTGWTPVGTTNTIAITDKITFNGVSSGSGGYTQILPSVKDGDDVLIIFDAEYISGTKPTIQYGKIGVSTIEISYNNGRNVALVTSNADVDFGLYLRQGSAETYNNVSFDNIQTLILSDEDKLLSADQLASKYQGYLPTGINHANGETVVTGKNFFDKNNIVYDKDLDSSGNLRSTANAFTSDYIPVLPSTKYYRNITDGLRYAYYDVDKNFIYAGTTFGIPSDYDNARYLRISGRYDNDTTLNSLQLEIGITATDYEPYQEPQVAPYVNLKKLPNGVADEYNPISGIVTRNVSEHTIQASDITIFTGFSNIDVAFVDKSADYKYYGGTSTVLGSSIFETKTEKTSAIIDSTDDIGKWSDKNQLNDYLVAYAKGTSLATMQADLENTVIVYQLATPITEQAEQSQLSYETGGIMYTDSPIAPKVEYKVNLNAASQRNANSNAIVRVEQESDRKSSENAANIALKPNRYSGSETFPIGLTDTVVNENVTADSLIRIYPQETTPGDKIGIWTVDSQAGQFVITSDVAETVAIPYVWEFLTGGE